MLTFVIWLRAVFARFMHHKVRLSKPLPTFHPVMMSYEWLTLMSWAHANYLEFFAWGIFFPTSFISLFDHSFIAYPLIFILYFKF